MRVRIHRGAHEIGGNCIEVEADDQRIVLDIGRPLTAGRDEHIPLPDVAGLTDGHDPSLLGVVISHGHQDHWGLMPQVPGTVPRYIGEGAADVLRAAEWWGTGIDLHETGHLRHREPLTLGPFTITPYLNDHSAFDAYSLLIEADGRRLFYTGDIRAHGRKSAIFDSLLADPPTGVNVLLCEGTNVHPDDGRTSKPVMTEDDVELAMAKTFADTEGLVVVLSSPQNIDRLVTTYRAALRSNRDLVIDLYSADVASATGRDTIPHLGEDWPRVHAFLPLRQRVKVKQSGEFTRAEVIRDRRVFAETLAENPSKYVLFGSYQSEIPRLLAKNGPGLGAVVWSLWDGYLPGPSGERLTKNLEAAGVPLIHHHTSGHAPPADLRRLVDALDAGRLVPVHTEHPEDFADLLQATETRRENDGAWWVV